MNSLLSCHGLHPSRARLFLPDEHAPPTVTRIHNKRQRRHWHLSLVHLSLTKRLMELYSQLPLPLAACINHTSSFRKPLCPYQKKRAKLYLPTVSFSIECRRRFDCRFGLEQQWRPHRLNCYDLLMVSSYSTATLKAGSRRSLSYRFP